MCSLLFAALPNETRLPNKYISFRIRYSEYSFAECPIVECCNAKCRNAECCYAECRYAGCRYAECRGALLLNKYAEISFFCCENKQTLASVR